MNKKGLSDVITNVLIILIVIVSIGTIAAFLVPLLKGTTDKSGDLNSCLTEEVLVKKCEVAQNGANDYNVSIVVSRGVGKAGVSEANIILNKEDGSSNITKLSSPGDLVEYASISHVLNRINFKPRFASVSIKLSGANNACEASEKVNCKMVSSVSGGGAVAGGGGTPPTVTDYLTGLIAYWKFDESAYTGASNEVKDSKGLNHGTPTSGANLSSSGANNGNALNLTGNNFITVNPNPLNSFSTIDSYTLSAWIKTSNNLPRNRIYGHQYGDYYHIIGLLNNKLWCPSSVSPDETLGVTYGQSLNDGVWHHVACIRDSNNKFYWYIDGEKVKETPINSRYSNSDKYWLGQGQGIYIGTYSNGGETYNGLIDDVRVYNVALTDQQIKDVRSATIHN